jgi:hypothetical protein
VHRSNEKQQWNAIRLLYSRMVPIPNANACERYGRNGWLRQVYARFQKELPRYYLFKTEGLSNIDMLSMSVYRVEALDLNVKELCREIDGYHPPKSPTTRRGTRGNAHGRGRGSGA